VYNITPYKLIKLSKLGVDLLADTFSELGCYVVYSKLINALFHIGVFSAAGTMSISI